MENTILEKTLKLAVKAVMPVLFTSLGAFISLTWPGLFANFCGG